MSKSLTQIVFALLVLCVAKPAGLQAQTITYGDGSPFQTTYCYYDSLYEIAGTPAGGTFSGCGVINKNGKWYFNPSKANTTSNKYPYQCQLIYTGPGNVTVSKNVIVQVPVHVSIIYDSITCDGDVILIGGNMYVGNNYYTWTPASPLDNPDSNSTKGFITQTTTFKMFMVDSNSGCTDSAYATIYKKPAFHFKLTYSISPINKNEITLVTTADDNYVIDNWHPLALFTNQTAKTQTVKVDTPTYISVTATSANECYANVGTVIPPYPASVNSAGNMDDNIKVYPNPANDHVFINAPMPVDATIISVDGKVVLQQRDATRIVISSLSDGMYLIRITDKAGHTQRIEKLTKIK